MYAVAGLLALASIVFAFWPVSSQVAHEHLGCGPAAFGFMFPSDPGTPENLPKMDACLRAAALHVFPAWGGLVLALVVAVLGTVRWRRAG